jgi:ABC-type multidrug transport system ATPase subunit
VTALEVAGVTAGYGDSRILDDLSLTVHDAEVVCLIGPNGAGKSTCLKVIAGLLPSTRGEVRVDGTLGYVPQVRNTFPSLTVRENLQVMARGWARAAVETRVADLLDDPRLGALYLGGDHSETA